MEEHRAEAEANAHDDALAYRRTEVDANDTAVALACDGDRHLTDRHPEAFAVWLRNLPVTRLAQFHQRAEDLRSTLP